MSKMYTLITALFLSMAVFAAERPNSGRLTIATFDNASIRVEIDGRRYSERDNTIRIDNISAGYHTIRIYRRTSGGVFSGSRESLVYSNSVHVKPQHQLDILIDRYGRAQVQEYNLNKKGRKKDRNNDWERRNDNDRWDDYDQWDRNDDTWNRRPDRDDRYDRNDRNDRDDRYGRGVSYETFQSMKQTLRRENFENTRLTLAKQMMERNSFQTAQVREMLQLFSFESNRLELAKQAYRHTVDKNNYYSLYDVFSFSTSKEELSRYIGNYR